MAGPSEPERTAHLVARIRSQLSELRSGYDQLRTAPEPRSADLEGLIAGIDGRCEAWTAVVAELLVRDPGPETIRTLEALEIELRRLAVLRSRALALDAAAPAPTRRKR